MELQDLEIFVALYHNRSITAAAEELNYAQPNISERLKKLEKELHQQLFFRNNHGIKPTNKGQLLYQKAVPILKSVNQIKNIFNDTEIGGTLHITAPQAIATTYLPRILAVYHSKFPKVKLIVSTTIENHDLSKPDNGKFDGGFISLDQLPDGFKKIRLYDETLCLVSAFSADDISHSDFIAFPKGDAYRERLPKGFFKKHEVIEVDSLSAIIAGVCSGLGISILPLSIVKPYLKNKVLKINHLSNFLTKLEIDFAYKPNKNRNLAMTNFIEELRNNTE